MFDAVIFVLLKDVANARATFRGAVFELSEGTAGNLVGTSFAIKNYPPKTSVTMFDELSLPVDMVVTHSFTPINSNIMAGRIKRQQRLMRASDDGAVSLLEELGEARFRTVLQRALMQRTFGAEYVIPLVARLAAPTGEVAS